MIFIHEANHERKPLTSPIAQFAVFIGDHVTSIAKLEFREAASPKSNFMIVRDTNKNGRVTWEIKPLKPELFLGYDL